MEETISTKKLHPKEEPEENEMSFWDHLEELRKHIFRSLAAILVFAIIAFLNKHFIFDTIILAPKDSDFITNRLLCRFGNSISFESLCLGDVHMVLQNISMSGQFMTHMYISLVVGFIVALPYVLLEFWRFITPALHPDEKKYSKGFVAAGTILFLTGVLFAYFILVPLTLNFFGNYHVSDQVANQIQLGSFISTVVSVTLSVGLVFELPIIIYFLTKVGIVTPQFLKKNRKIMFVIVLTLSAIITPPDIFSQVLVSIPLLLLYEMSIKISKRVYDKREEEMAG
jgi:sec-independent protein translocase protein TatC